MPYQRVLVVLPVLALAAAGCGGSSADSQGDASTTADPGAARHVAGHHVTVSMTDFRFKPSSLTAKAGKLRVTAKSAGHEEHEFVLIRTSKAVGALPVKGKEAPEAGSVGEISEQKPGKGATHTFNLKPGRYTFICNVPGHYRAGMYGTLTVK
jgi:uncharacterized cupredoxin-like copper-binding protein